jgi:hypothetical protein
MKLSSSRVLQVGPCREVFPLPEGDGEIVHVHAVGPSTVRVALMPTAEGSTAEQIILPRTTAQFRLDQNKFISLRAMPEHDASAHTKVVLSIGTDVIED